MKNYTLGKYLYFDLLVELNYTFFNNEEKGSNVRILDNKTLSIIDKKIEELISKKNNNSFDLNNLLNTIGFIWLIQPFLDGNTRTVHLFIKKYLNYFGYTIDIQNNKDIIPLFYHEEEICSAKHFEKIKRLLKTNNNHN